MVGFHHIKAKNLIAMSKQLIKDFDGVAPSGMEAFQKIKGVGPKIALVTLNECYGIAEEDCCGFPSKEIFSKS